MTISSEIPTLVTTVTWMFLSVIVWSFLNANRNPTIQRTLLDTSDSLLLGFLMVASFAMGVFVTYILLIIR